MRRNPGTANQSYAMGGRTVKLYAPMSKKRLSEIRSEVPVIIPHARSVGNVRGRIHKLQRKVTLIRQKQQEQDGIPVEVIHELVQKSTGKVICKRGMTDQEAARKNRAGLGSYWRRVGY